MAAAASGEGVTLYSLAVELFGDSSRLKSDMANAATFARKSGGEAGSNFALGFQNPMLNAIGGIRQLVGGVQDSLGILGKATGVDIAATYERLQLGFQSLSGSASSAKAIMADLSAMGSSTPFRTEDLTSYAQNLLALGVNANKVTGDLAALADATAARGGSTESLGELSNIVSGFRLRPRLDIREVAEIGRFMDLSKVVGAATGRQGINTMQASSLLSNMRGDKAYELIISGAQKVYGGAAAGQGGNTVTGLTQNLVESFNLAMKPTGDALLPEIKWLEKHAIDAAKAVARWNAATGGSAGLTVMIVGGIALMRRFGNTARSAWDTTRGLTSAVTQYAEAASAAAVASRQAAAAELAKAGAEEVGTVVAIREGEAEIGKAAASGIGTAGIAGMFAKNGKLLEMVTGTLKSFGLLALAFGAEYGGEKLKEAHPGNLGARLGGSALQDGAIGASIGFMIGKNFGPYGAAIGAAAGGIVGSSYGMITEKMKFTEDQKAAKEQAANTAALQKNTDAMLRLTVKTLGGGALASGTASLLEAEYSLAQMA